MASEDLEEQLQPLLQPRPDRGFSYKQVESLMPILPEPESVMEYKTSDLATWRTYTYYAGTMLQNRLQWWVVFKLMGIALTVALILIFSGTDPDHLRIFNLESFVKALNFFVGIMLAFFMTSSVTRWVNTVGGYLSLFDACRNLVMQFHALGVEPSKVKQVMRYALLSCEFLNVEMHTSNKKSVESEEEVALLFSHLGAEFETWEREAIQKLYMEKSQVSSLLWIWVANFLGRMAQDGDIPPMASPTYGRIMTLAQDAQEGIRQVRVSMTVQMPFIYVHTLAFLVHGSNIFSAFDLGLNVAVNLSGILYFNDVHFWQTDKLSKGLQKQEGGTLVCMENMIISFITLMVAPLMYQAFLQIGLTLAQPFDDAFGSGISAIPTQKLIAQLKSDIDTAEDMVNCIGGWKPPNFKQSIGKS